MKHIFFNNQLSMFNYKIIIQTIDVNVSKNQNWREMFNSFFVFRSSGVQEFRSAFYEDFGQLGQLELHFTFHAKVFIASLRA